MAQQQVDDIVKISPDVHKVLFENHVIRVLKVTVKPGDAVPMHRNPENINYVLKAGTLRLLSPDGSSVDVQVTEGQILPAPVGEHAVENLGSAEVQTICIELKG